MRGRALIGLALLLAGCKDAGPTFSLYRNSPFFAGMRIHWATFDADESGNFNEGNCQLAARLLNQQAPAGVQWWCEEGHAHSVTYRLFGY